MTRRERAIAYIEKCRDVHQDWIEMQDRGELSRTQLRIGGGKTHHRLWVRRYEAVLRELRRIAPPA
jgi:hypothetical protein